MKKITEYEIVDHGINNSQYFQGCGTCLTDFEYIVTGCGDNPKEAFEDAIEQIYQIESKVEISEIEPITEEKPSVSHETYLEISNNLRDFIYAEEYEDLLEDDDAYSEKVNEIIEDRELGMDTYYYLSIRFNLV